MDSHTTNTGNAMDMDEGDYHLYAQLKGHGQDVRSVCVLQDETIVTSSRDRTVKLWRNVGDKGWSVWRTLLGHTHFVSVVVPIPSCPSTSITHGGVASGGHDNIINVWNIDLNDPATEPLEIIDANLILTGHTNTISTLHYLDSNKLVSGSWDFTAKIWNLATGQCEVTLNGHTQAVWSVLPLPNSTVLTASADKTIKMWNPNSGICSATFSGHTDVVRNLKLLPGSIGFASSCNDGSIRIWSFTGQCLKEFYAHNSFVFALAVKEEDQGLLRMATGGEDSMVKVWTKKQTTTKSGSNNRAGVAIEDEGCEQIILLGSTVWAVTFMNKSSDLITATADGVARIWSKNPAKKIANSELQTFNDNIAEVLKQAEQRSSANHNNNSGPSSEGLSGINTQKLPTLDELRSRVGRRDEETVMVREPNTGAVAAYTWKESSHSWEYSGSVTGAVTTQQNKSKSLARGKEYDYIFSVDLGDGQDRKLGYNRGENPYLVAQNFLTLEELPQGYLDQVADFIIKNSADVVIGQQTGVNSSGGGGGGYVDPYTGGSRYIPKPVSVGGTTGNGGGAANSDPFTGGSRYVPPSPSIPSTSLLSTSNTSTSSSSNTTGFKYITANQANSNANNNGANNNNNNNNKIIPNKQMVFYDSGNYDAILAAITKTNTAFSTSSDPAVQKLAIPTAIIKPSFYSEFSTLQSLVSTLSNKSMYHATTVSRDQIFLLFKTANQWPKSERLPILDLLRLAIIHPTSPPHFASYFKINNNFSLFLKSNSEQHSLIYNQIMIIRFLCNMFKSLDVFQGLISLHQSLVLETAGEVVSVVEGEKLNDLLAVAVMSLMLNFGAVWEQGRKEFEGGEYLEQGLSVIGEVLGEGREIGEEVGYRGLVAMGTMVWKKEEKGVMEEMGLWEVVERQGKRGGKVKEVADEIMALKKK